MPEATSSAAVELREDGTGLALCPCCESSHRFREYRDELVGETQPVTLALSPAGPRIEQYCGPWELWTHDSETVAVYGWVCEGCGAAFDADGRHAGDEGVNTVAEMEPRYADVYMRVGVAACNAIREAIREARKIDGGPVSKDHLCEVVAAAFEGREA